MMMTSEVPLGNGGTTHGGVRFILRLEGFAVGVAALIAYQMLDWGWLRFAILILSPDLSMLGYLAGPKIGAAAYNAVHTYVGPLLVAGFSLWGGSQASVAAAVIWLAHIGFDRALGYGLKYEQGFGVTHLGMVGRMRAHT
jgi:hypothetical protein